MNLAQLMMAANRDDEDDDAPALTEAQQITRLTEYFAQVYAPEPERFEPGQAIWHKSPEMADTRNASRPGLFARYLDAPLDVTSGIADPREFYSNSATARLNATVLVMQDGRAVEYFIDTRCFTATKPGSAKA